ncbi:putative cystathionine gamma-synthase/beta-lyase [Apodospora peruviana]|uniref:Cystathionine gamma-synthase/beta-lyase n=1 Tax=Apodospora peruviana TaxID=516989 RepID=A0AAE0HX43_9PEZI|nr:putative cystathionine gamma-synthase/beta-lyase [Apodospora peruviana]
MALIIRAPETLPLGSPLPPGDEHAISVHLPTWTDTVGWASHDPRVVNVMKTGYPRFFVPRVVDRLVQKMVEGTSFTWSSGLGMAFASNRYRTMCYEFLLKQPDAVEADISIFDWHWEEEADTDPGEGKNTLYTILFPQNMYGAAKAFWQHTGYGISSRRAEFWLESAPSLNPRADEITPLEDRFHKSHGENARHNIIQRIADGQSTPSLRVLREDIFLYQSGMTAITEAATAIRDALCSSQPGKPCVMVIYGFLYVDTFKVLKDVLDLEATMHKYTPSEIDGLEARLETGTQIDALFTEFPGNPLLQAPDLDRLHQLSRKHGFVLVVDDTVGTYVNVNLMPVCDVVCTSLSKMFSGACNVMGGSVVLSPTSPHRDTLRSALLDIERQTDEREDDDTEGDEMEDQYRKYESGICFYKDVIVLEENSRGFRDRVTRANGIALSVVRQLRAYPSVVRVVYYPLGSPTQGIYDRFIRQGDGYGFLLSIKFVTPGAAAAFYDALDVAKGPSLGTNFTLCCAYTLLAHYRELGQAAGYGVFEHLVRISVGLEGEEWLRGRVEKAMMAAESRVWLEFLEGQGS